MVLLFSELANWRLRALGGINVAGISQRAVRLIFVGIFLFFTTRNRYHRGHLLLLAATTMGHPTGRLILLRHGQSR